MNVIKTWHTGMGLIIFAMLTLIYLGWKGQQGQRALVWQDAHADCQRWSQLAAQQLPTVRQAKQQTIKLYAYPPSPGIIEFSADAEKSTLKHWQDQGGTTTTGLPVRALAGLVLLQKNPKAEEATRLADLVRFNEPSAITPNILEAIGHLQKKHSWNLDLSDWKKRWHQDEMARELTRSKQLDGWHDQQGQLWWGKQQQDQTLSYATPESLQQNLNEIATKQLKLPAWAGLQLRFQNASLGDSGQQAVTTTIDTTTKFELSAGVIRPDLLEFRWNEARQWNFMIMALACSGLIAGIGVVGLGAAKEKKRHQQQNNFIASVTHELRAPVGSMRLMAEALESGKVNRTKVSEFHHLIAREAGRLSHLIENVLDLAQIEAGKSQHRLKPIELTDIVSQAAETFHMQANEKGISLQFSSQPLQVQIDPLSFQQALVNLIDNAIKFSPDQGRIAIDWGAKNLQWWISVTDAGPGIDAAEKEKIFERFYRSGDEMKRETQGAGIGLNLVQRIVAQHRGKISVSNVPGACFKLTFPSQPTN